jgi:hypothetical protein
MIPRRALVAKKKKKNNNNNKKPAFYAVHTGRKPGVYTSWYGAGGAEEAVRGYYKAVFKRFYNEKDAQKFLETGRVEAAAAASVAAAAEPETYRCPDSPFGVNGDGWIQDDLVIFCDGACVYDQATRRWVGSFSAYFGHGDERNFNGVMSLEMKQREARCLAWACAKVLMCLKNDPQKYGWQGVTQNVVLVTETRAIIRALRAHSSQAKHDSIIDSLFQLASVMPVSFLYLPKDAETQQRPQRPRQTADRMPLVERVVVEVPVPVPVQQHQQQAVDTIPPVELSVPQQ